MRTGPVAISVAILMPAYNEASRLQRTLALVQSAAASLERVTVFVVDDGSDPAVDAQALPETTASFSVLIARHPVNLGQGAALETARRLALEAPPFDAYVTMDADGQHRIEDAIALAQAVEEGADVAFGNRFLGDSNVPRGRRLLLKLAQSFERALTGLRLTDAHNGLRGFNRRALEQVTIRQNRMAHATEIKQSVSRVLRASGLKIVEVPVSLRYSPDTMQKGQRATGAAAILTDLLGHYLFGEAE